MSFTEGDVLNTLGDPIAQNMTFRVGQVHISGKSYGIIRDHIRVGDILVVEGDEGLAFYDGKTDILTTQIGTPPANLDQRGLLLHECTHALVDIFTYGVKVTRHIDELSAYLAQHVYIMRSDPSWTVGPNNPPWFMFFSTLANTIKSYRLETPAGNGATIAPDDLEALRILLASLPGVNYGHFKKDDATGADGLIRMNPFLNDGVQEEVSMRSSSTSRETYPDPTDDYLIRTLLEEYAASDVKGYGQRLRSLRKDFAKCSLGKAKQLQTRLIHRIKGDRVSELFYDRLSAGGRAILLRVLRNRL